MPQLRRRAARNCTLAAGAAFGTAGAAFTAWRTVVVGTPTALEPARTSQTPSAGADLSGQPACGHRATSTAGLTVGLVAGFGLAAQRRKGRQQMHLQRHGGTQRAAGTVDTFLVQGPVDASKLATKCAPLAALFDLDCLAFFSLGVPPEVVGSVAGGALGLHGVCPVYIADCYGIIGHDEATGSNVELMEKGRGTEFGGPGGNGGTGVVVVAFRGGAHVGTVGESPLPADRGMHLVVRGSGLPEAPAAGAVCGGVAKSCYQLEHSGDLVEVPQFAVSTSAGVISSFTGDAGEAAEQAMQALPEGAAPPTAAGYFPCFMRGVNQYGKDGVEPAAFGAKGLAARLFGMFAHGEMGPPKGPPIVCAAEAPPKTELEMHSMTSVLALYSA